MRRSIAVTIAAVLFSVHAHADTVDDVATKDALARQAAVVDLSRSATIAHRVTTTAVTDASKLVAPMQTGGLGRLSAGTSGSATTGAGAVRETVLARNDEFEKGKFARPLATQRTLRRMNAERMSIDPDLRACANEHGTPSAMTLTFRLSVTPSGDVEDSEIVSPQSVPAPLLACITDAVSVAHFGSPGPSGATVAMRFVVPAAEKRANSAVADGSQPAETAQASR